MNQIQATTEEINAAFTEWDRRFRADPAAFMSQAESLIKGTPKTYGDSATPYFLSILEELRK